MSKSTCAPPLVSRVLISTTAAPQTRGASRPSTACTTEETTKWSWRTTTPDHPRPLYTGMMTVPPPNTSLSRKTLAARSTIRSSSVTASLTSLASSADRTRSPPCTPPLSDQYKSHNRRASIMRVDMSSPSARDPTSAVVRPSRLSARAGKKNSGGNGVTFGGGMSAPVLSPDDTNIEGAPRGVGGAKVVTVATECGSPS